MHDFISSQKPSEWLLIYGDAPSPLPIRGWLFWRGGAFGLLHYCKDVHKQILFAEPNCPDGMRNLGMTPIEAHKAHHETPSGYDCLHTAQRGVAIRPVF